MNLFSSSRNTIFLLATLLGITTLAYLAGLDGAFMFDDVAHISKNKLIAINGLGPGELHQAWNSSPFNFPGNRPFSMLTFGINHALFGLNPFWFKAVNLLIHLLCAVGFFILTRHIGELYSRIQGIEIPGNRLNQWALLAAGLWVLHPLNLSPVLYIVQRMTSLSALFSILAILCYLYGRRRMLDGKSGYLAILVGVPALSFLAFLCKENGILVPGYLLALEFTLFRAKGFGGKASRFLQLFLLIGVIIPAVAACIYLLINPEIILNGYARRQFTLGERLLTEGRIIWFYIQMLLLPDNSLLGFYHDDITISRGLFNPPATLAAICGLLGLLLAAIFGRRRYPILSFGILFFFIGHTLESTIIPLELVYEHRNYLPDFGLLFVLSYYLTTPQEKPWLSRATTGVAISLLCIMTVTTAIRAKNWSSEISLIVTEAEHHPDSPRVNFRAGQLMIARLQRNGYSKEVYEAARYYLEKTVALNPRNADGLFGLIILHLHNNKPVEQRWLDELKHRLEHIPYDPQNITTSQFSYLTRWHMSDGPKLRPNEVLGIFNAVLRNPKLDKFAGAGIHNALMGFYRFALNQPKEAIKHARKAVALWPERWHYQRRLIELLVEQGSLDEAKQQLQKARQADVNNINLDHANKLEQLIQAARQNTTGKPIFRLNPMP
ncbi:tetratricopeptide repeat protein [Pseudomonadota bacterium]